jgi:hypothetical protein
MELREIDITRRHVRAGEFVPINVGGDGAFEIAVRGRVGPSAVSEREERYRLVSSEPYLLISHGMLELGGLESVGNYSGAEKIEIPLTAGRYSVIIHLIDWKAEPGAADSTGKPTANALPDFVIVFSDAQSVDAAYRSKVDTFERLT